MAERAKPAAFAGEGQQALILTVIAADTSEAPFQLSAVQILIHHLRDDRAQEAAPGLVR